jgi:hypothetical protein
MPRAECASCGSKLPAKARFCSNCGAQVGAQPGDTAVQELPPSEPEETPIYGFISERRLFGVPPVTFLFGISVAASTLAILLLATEHLAWGLILLALAALALGGFISQFGRLPGDAPRFGRVSVAALDMVRARAGAAVETVAAQGSARIELAGLRRDVAELVATRDERLRELGEAVHQGNRSATKELKQRLKQLDDEINEKEKEMRNVTTEAQERIERAQMAVQPTQVVPQDEEQPAPDEAPEPARVPEPFPPPDEGEPPQPAQVPEPFPPPDEADRPQQPTIPEPGPE